jgi:hypothetical protein
MATTSTRWNLVVSSDLDKSLRKFLAAEGRSKKGELSRFVEDAVRKEIFDSTLKAARKHNEGVDPKVLDEEIEEALAWARKKRR